MEIEIWSDIVCPFCYIGKRKFENALKAFAHKDSVKIIWRSFQLDPGMVQVAGESVHQYLAKRKGVSLEKGKEMNAQMAAIAAEVGLIYNFDKAIIHNTLDAHRLLHLAYKHDVQNEMKEALFAAYYTGGKNLGDRATLISIGETVGLDANEMSNMLTSNEFENDVKLDQDRAAQVGVQGVPFFVFNNKYAVSGAQPTEVFADVLNKVWEEEKPLVPTGDSAGVCNVDGVCN